MVSAEFHKRRLTLLLQTQKALRESVTPDTLIIQALGTLDDLTVQLNAMSKRLREWHGYTLPEVGNKLADHEAFVRLVATRSRRELAEEFLDEEGMGALLDEKDYIQIKDLARAIGELFEYKNHLEHYLNDMLERHVPNMTALAGATIAARLLAGAGSLRRLALLPASTLQLLGAEKALFRHLKTGARSPKYGYLFNHPFVQHAGKDVAGKVARGLADKLALCAKLDYFKGEFKGKHYREELERKFAQR